MIKGINKRVIMLRLDGNRFYESACFVVRRDLEKKRDEERDMLREANRILEEIGQCGDKKSKGKFKKFIGWMIILLVGAVIGFGTALLFR